MPVGGNRLLNSSMEVDTGADGIPDSWLAYLNGGLDVVNGRTQDAGSVEHGEWAWHGLGHVSPGNRLSANQSSVETDLTGLEAEGSTTIARLATDGLDGAACLELTATANDYITAKTSIGLAGAPVTPGEVVTCLAWVRPETTARSCHLSIRWYDVAGTYLGGASGPTFLETAGLWSGPLWVAEAAPANAVFMSLAVRFLDCVTGEKHRVDMLSMRRSWKISLFRSDTIKGLTGGSGAGGTFGVIANTVEAKAAATIITSTSTAVGDSWIRLSPEGAGEGEAKVAAGVTYQFGIWARLGSGPARNAKLDVHFRDAANTTILNVAVTAQVLISSDTDWTLISGAYVAPANSDHVVVMPHHMATAAGEVMEFSAPMVVPSETAITDFVDGWGLGVGNNSNSRFGLRQDVAGGWISGKPVTFSAYLKLSTLLPAAAYVFLYAEWRDAADALIGATVLTGNQLAVTTTRQRFSLTFTPTGEISTIRFYVWVSRNTSQYAWWGYFDIDAVQAERGDEATAYFPHESERDPGDLVTLEYQYEFGGLLFGSETDFRTTQVTGLLSMSARDADTDLQNEHGAAPGSLLMSKRIIAFDLTALGDAGSDIEEKLAELREVFKVPRKRNARTMEPFVFWRPGLPKMRVMVRCAKREFTSDYKTARGLAEGSVELVAPDPVIYSLDLLEESITLAPTVTSGEVTIENIGDYSDGYFPVLRVAGPANNPRFQNVDDDTRTITTQISLDGDDVLEIDVKTRIVTVNGAPNYGAIKNDKQWWAVLPLLNTITYNRDAANSGASSTFEIEWRHTWN